MTQGRKMAVRNQDRPQRLLSLSALANSRARISMIGTWMARKVSVLVSARMKTGSWVRRRILAKPPKLKFMPRPTWKLIQSDHRIG